MPKLSVIGAGTMGTGIAQVAATAGWDVVINDTNNDILEKSSASLVKVMNRLVEKEKIDQATADKILGRIDFTEDQQYFENSDLVIEAIVENLEIKQKVFKAVEEIVREDTIIASNTSSLSLASIGASLKDPSRFVGIHFFNPAPLMPLVEIIPAVQTAEETTQQAKDWVDSWKKLTVLAKDTPGFIVNRVARPFYGESLRMYEEGIADFATIDWAMKELGGFRMGPFELMDFIGNDINYTVTETVFASFFYDPRYKPSFTQKRMSEAGFLGRKSGRGYYDYAEGAVKPEPKKDEKLGQQILDRTLAMLINEAADALFLNIASREDIDTAMTKGVNYPKGLLKWADEKGIDWCVEKMDALYDEYREDRYRCSPLLRRMKKEGKTFY
ncbi:3-hydroxybutyryl-CoA dehydrogenase [Ekhidna lutea]|uniref:3-hydroxybutyryl-CoA dehydrogenase n=1 Tax=Ekhidna lutea TaxID=447679 RepID=A0A239J9E5_EKHLU|nr:3-hydroxyacyl-CoA dehydrogenase NAD-binding domain-containing protein [Ekhidna lutea]SNT01274.1 3-hydroxybutyryl-CoA dehydrogenase [Ekhidna lutea]